MALNYVDVDLLEPVGTSPVYIGCMKVVPGKWGLMV